MSLSNVPKLDQRLDHLLEAMFEVESLYEDDRHHLRSSNSREILKLPLSTATKDTLAVATAESQLLSPLALTTPDLESFITASSLALVTSCTTPTPTQLLRTVSASATSEQEEYAKGFVDALQRIRQLEAASENLNTTATTFTALNSHPTAALNSHPTAEMSRPRLPSCQQPVVTASGIPFSVQPAPPSNVSSGPLQHSGYLQGFNANANANANANFLEARLNPTFPVEQRLASLQAEQLQIVPGTPPPPHNNPLDPGLQEELKRRRKKERNRLAASKCRKRRLEKEAVLEEHVKVMKQENGQLQAEVNNLRQVVFKLKQMVLAHASGGCKVMQEQAGLEEQT